MSKEDSPLVAALLAPAPPKSPLGWLRQEIELNPAVGEAIITARHKGKSMPEIAAILTDHLCLEITTPVVKRWLRENN